MDFTFNLNTDPGTLLSADGVYIICLCSLVYFLLGRYEMGAIRFHFVLLLAVGMVLAKLLGGVELLAVSMALLADIGFFHLWFSLVTFVFTLTLFFGNLKFKEAVKVASISAGVVFALAWFFTE